MTLAGAAFGPFGTITSKEVKIGEAGTGLRTSGSFASNRFRDERDPECLKVARTVVESLGDGLKALPRSADDGAGAECPGSAQGLPRTSDQGTRPHVIATVCPSASDSVRTTVGPRTISLPLPSSDSTREYAIRSPWGSSTARSPPPASSEL